MKMLEENRPPCEPAQSKTLRSRTRGFVNHYETLRLRSNSITSGQTYTPARICSTFLGGLHKQIQSVGNPSAGIKLLELPIRLNREIRRLQHLELQAKGISLEHLGYVAPHNSWLEGTSIDIMKPQSGG